MLSGGRVIAGVGAGWMREEFEALGTPPFAERGAVTDEYLQAWQPLWTHERRRCDGKYAKFDNVVFAPKPASQPHPPIWVGGESAPALRRTVQFGDAWYPVSNNQTDPPEHAGRASEAGIERLHRVAEKAGRDPASIDVGYLWFMPADVERADRVPTARGRCSPAARDDMLADAAAPGEAGARHVIVLSATPDDRGNAGRDPALRRRRGTQGA